MTMPTRNKTIKTTNKIHAICPPPPPFRKITFAFLQSSFQPARHIRTNPKMPITMR